MPKLANRKPPTGVQMKLDWKLPMEVGGGQALAVEQARGLKGIFARRIIGIISLDMLKFLANQIGYPWNSPETCLWGCD